LQGLGFSDFFLKRGFPAKVFALTGPYLGFFVCGGKLRFRTNISTRNSPTKSNTMLEKEISFLGRGNCPPCPPAMYGPD